MRIAVFGHKHIFTTEGGIEVVVSELIPLLAKDNDVTVYDRYEIDGDGKFPVGENQFDNVHIKKAPTFKKSAVNAQLSSMTATFKCMFGPYDVVHIHAEGPCVFMWLLKLARKKTVVTIHGLDWQRDKWGKFASWYIHLGEKMAAKYADEIIVLSKGVQDYFRETYGRETHFIRNGVNVHPDFNTDEIEKFNLKKGEYILYLGRFAPEKRLDLLYEAYKKSGVDMKLVLAGPFADLDQENDWYKRAAADPDVLFTGHADGRLKTQLFSNAAMFVLPSNLEGMSISLLEAMGYGCRIIASNIPENKNVLGKFGETFETGDVDSLSNAILRASEKDHEPSMEQVRFVKEHYDWEHVADETLKIYRNILEK